jgi:Tol biopolymer transport system component
VYRAVLSVVCVVFPFVVFVSQSFAQYARVSISSAGGSADHSSITPSISDDGRFVAFLTAATNFVAGDTNNNADIYLHDRDADADGIFDEPGARTTVRVSVTTTGAQFTGDIGSPVISGDGRYVAFTSNDLVPIGGDPANHVTQILRWDRLTGAIDVVSRNAAGELGLGSSSSPDMSRDGRLFVFISSAINFAGVDSTQTPNVYLKDMQTGSIERLSALYPIQTGSGPSAMSHYYVAPSISADGRRVAFTRVTMPNPSNGTMTGTVFIADVGAGGPAVPAGDGTYVRLSDSGLDLLVRGATTSTQTDLGRLHVATRERLPAMTVSAPALGDFLGLAQDARHAMVLIEHTPTPQSVLYDTLYGRTWPLPFTGFAPAAFDANSRYVAFTTIDHHDPGDTNNEIDIYVVDLWKVFDVDHDTLDDRWETMFGLSASSGAGADGPSGDPDGDGVTNADEQAAGTHPRGLYRSYLAEGASGTFFRTRLALANPSSTDPANTIVSFLRPSEPPIRAVTPLSAGHRVTVSPTAFTGLEAADFSIAIESDRPIVADRTMQWDATGYGAHTETAAPAASTTWYLAEGSTVVDFNLFYLLQNPQPTPVDATIRFLRPSGDPIVKTQTLPPNSRTTIYVNEADPALAESDVSGVIEASAPIVVERAMYANRPNQPFALGHAAKGVTEPSTHWFLAEGATGGFFDLYVLIANPSTSAAKVEVRFLKPDGSVVPQSYTLAPQTRFSIYVDSVPGLADTSVATLVTSTNDVPVIVERAMYWPGGFFDYYEGHSSAGTTTTATRWALAEGEEGGPDHAQTFVLIANTSDQPGQVRIRRLRDVATAGDAEPIVLDLQPNSRTTVELSTASPAISSRFGALVESIGASPVPIVVEGAFYWSPGGVTWAAGSNIVATPLP